MLSLPAGPLERLIPDEARMDTFALLFHGLGLWRSW